MFIPFSPNRKFALKLTLPPFLRVKHNRPKEKHSVQKYSMTVCVYVCVYTLECQCGCELQAWDNTVLASGLQPPASDQVSASAADKGGQAEALSCRAALHSCLCVMPVDLCCLCVRCTNWLNLVSCSTVFKGMARLCRPRPSWIKPQINVKVCSTFWTPKQLDLSCFCLDRALNVGLLLIVGGAFFIRCFDANEQSCKKKSACIAGKHFMSLARSQHHQLKHGKRVSGNAVEIVRLPFDLWKSEQGWIITDNH